MRRPEQLIAGAVLGVLAATTARARADDMSAMTTADDSAVGVGASLLAASYSTTYYVGSYQGIVPAASWSSGKWSATGMVGIYHLEENGLDVYGAGDAMLSGSRTLVGNATWRTGVTLGASLPTGNMDHGLGMGHAMLMPALWAARNVGMLALSASAGYTRGLADLDGHVHGLWPLVEPMNMQELAWRAAAALPVGNHLSVGAYASGGVPIAVPMGTEHAIGALRAAWRDARMATAVEVQAGLVGDPVSIRGVVETTVRF